MREKPNIFKFSSAAVSCAGCVLVFLRNSLEGLCADVGLWEALNSQHRSTRTLMISQGFLKQVPRVTAAVYFFVSLEFESKCPQENFNSRLTKEKLGERSWRTVPCSSSRNVRSP